MQFWIRYQKNPPLAYYLFIALRDWFRQLVPSSHPNQFCYGHLHFLALLASLTSSQLRMIFPFFLFRRRDSFVFLSSETQSERASVQLYLIRDFPSSWKTLTLSFLVLAMTAKSVIWLHSHVV